jgi:hypothetical protein
MHSIHTARPSVLTGNTHVTVKPFMSVDACRSRGPLIIMNICNGRLPYLGCMLGLTTCKIFSKKERKKERKKEAREEMTIAVDTSQSRASKV